MENSYKYAHKYSQNVLLHGIMSVLTKHTTKQELNMNNLKRNIAQYWDRIQGQLFPCLEEVLGLLTDKHKQLAVILEVVRIEEFVKTSDAWMGRPPADRRAIVRSFIAKHVYNLPTTRDLIDRLKTDNRLRRICGWESMRLVPSESTFSRAFAEFSSTDLPARAHEALIKNAYKNEIVGQVSRDAVAIEAREKPKSVRTDKEDSAKPIIKKTKTKGRPKAGEACPEQEPTRIQKQLSMTLAEMMHDLPKDCDRGTKRNSKGYTESWNGFKLHLDTEDNGVVLSAILTSASVHDSQVAIPLATMTASRVPNLYDLMDAAYDVKEIKEHSRSLNHVPIIDVNPRRDASLKEAIEAECKARRAINWKPAEAVRYNGRTIAEHSNGRLKDEFGGRTLRVKGHAKAFCHLMFGILILSVDQLMRLA
jgi:hypothetical protein